MPEYSFDFFVRGYHDFEDGMGDDFEDAAGPAPWVAGRCSRKTDYPVLFGRQVVMVTQISDGTMGYPGKSHRAKGRSFTHLVL